MRSIGLTGRIGRIGLIFFMVVSLLSDGNEAALTRSAASSFSLWVETDRYHGYPFRESDHPDRG
jgi:hypothetical protein